MWTFILGLLVGVFAKTVYDLFREDQLPVGTGLNTGRLEALLDDTRQGIRELRDELQKAVGGAAGVRSGLGSPPTSTLPASEGDVASASLAPDAPSAASEGAAPGATAALDSGARFNLASAPVTTRGTLETMS